MLPAVARYLEAPGVWMLPAGLAGSASLFPIDDARIRPARVTLRIGPPVRASELLAEGHGDRKATMDLVGAKIAALLPQALPGVR